MFIESNVPDQLARIFEADITFANGRRFRPAQRVLAMRDAKHRTMRWDLSAHAPLMLQQAGTGIGKTFEQLFVSGLFALEGHRTVISIHTVALRQQIFKEQARVQEALEAAYACLGLPKPRKIEMAELVSLSQYISRAKVEDFNKSMAKVTSVTEEDRADWTEFYEFVQQWLPTPDHQYLEMHDWFVRSGGKPLPLDLSPLSLGLESTSEGIDDDVLVNLQANQQFALTQADIVVVTHTMLPMLTWKLRHCDSMEKKGQNIKHDVRPITFVSVDEAHTLPKITRNWIEQAVHFDVVRETLNSAPIDVSAATDAFTMVEEFVNGKLDKAGRYASLAMNNPYEWWPLVEIVEPFYDRLLDIYDKIDEYPLFRSKIESILFGLHPILLLAKKSGGSGQEVRGYVDSDAYPILSRRDNRIAITIKAGPVGRAIASLWRRNPAALNKRTYQSVIMMSGTLIDAQPDPVDPYRYFRSEIGATRTGGPDREVIWYGGVIHSANVGHATRVVYPERSEKLMPTINQGEINPAHTQYIAKMLAFIYDMPHTDRNRVLGLFMSQDGMQDTYDALRRLRPDIEPHIIVQRSGMRFLGTPLDMFRGDARAILLSMNWAGINAVDEQERSLVDHLVLAKAPFVPADERKQLDVNLGYAIKTMFHEAMWLMRQAFGRAMRDETARFTLWLGDVRIPLPDALTPPYPRYVKQNSPFMQRLYDLFNLAISQRLFGLAGKSRTGLLAGTVRLGYLVQRGDVLELKEHDVILTPQPEDMTV